MKEDWIKDIVIGLVETYGTNDVYLLCDFLNIEILRTSNNSKCKSYFIRNAGGDEFIFIQPGLDFIEKRSLIAHELGHALLHTWLNVSFYCKSLCNKGQFELQADRFAAELLLIDADLESPEWEGSTLATVSEELMITKDLLKIKQVE